MWFYIALTALFAHSSSSSHVRLVETPPSSTRFTDAAGFAVLHFLSTWRTAWLQSTAMASYGYTDIRKRDIHCHSDGSYGSYGQRGNYHPPSLIHRSSRRSMCPNWFPSDEPPPVDERVDRDASLTPAWRAHVRVERAKLLDSLAALDKLHPGDAWITGQRVRFLVNQGDRAGAIVVARSCTAGRAWCAQLLGFALHTDGQYALADSAFDAATAAMLPKQQCEWTSANLVLDEDGRSAYEHLSCDKRPAVNERLWWLSTPLFSDTIDDRRSENFARKVLVQLHSALPWDERYDWRERYGGEAVGEMLTRYGWPAFSAFGGASEESSHASWMNFYDSTRTATAEYTQDRVHLVPDWRAIADPFHASANAWQVNMPPLVGDAEPAAPWWPAEHYSRASGGIVQLPDQTVLLRRDSTVLLATASDLGPPGRSFGRDTEAVLVHTTAPHKLDKLPHRTYNNAHSIVLMASISAEPAILGAELPAARPGDLSGRTRFGVVPPTPLAFLGVGGTAISDPVLLSADDTAPVDPEHALSHMLGSSHVRGAKLGVYWETYGYAPGDSVNVAIVIERHEPVGSMRRLGMILHVAHDLNGSVAVRWQEPQLGHDSWTIPAVVPIQARAVRVDLSQLQPGHYAIVVLVSRHRGLPVSSSRDFIFDGT